jgi:hypothetical protein
MAHRDPIPDTVIEDIISKLREFAPCVVEEESTPRRACLNIDTDSGEYFLLIERV